jgi:hypothetical protein
VDAPFFVYGERYDDPAVHDDTPQLVTDLGVFEDVKIRVVLDGRTLLDGTGTELDDFKFGPVYFDEPIVYAGPQFRFLDENGKAVNAVAALFVEGIGTVFHPLPVGEHTLVNIVHSSFFGDFEFTYHITVSPM